MTGARLASGRGLLVVLGLLSAFGPWSIDMYLPGLPAMTRDLHTSAAPAQLTLTAVMVGLALGQLAGGPLSDAFGRRRCLLPGLAAFALASLACAAAPEIWTLVALRVVQGAAGGVGIVIARAVVRDLHEGIESARIFALLMVVVGIAPIVAPVVGGQVLRVVSWRGIFVVLVALGAGLLALAAARVPETLAPERRHRGGFAQTLRTFRRLAADRTFVPSVGVYGLGFGALFAYISASPFVLQEVYGLSPQVFSFVFAGNALAMASAAQLCSRLVGRTGPAALVRLGLAVLAAASALVLAGVVSGAGLPAVIPGLLLLTSGVGFVMPNATALALAGQGEAAGSASALLGLSQSALGSIVAPLVGVAGAHTGLPMAVAIASCAGCAIALQALPRVRPRRPAPRPC